MTKLMTFLAIIIISFLLKGVGNTFFHGVGNYLLIFSFILGVLGLIPATIAAKKGKSFAKWWLYGYVLFAFALVHSIFLEQISAAMAQNKVEK